MGKRILALLLLLTGILISLSGCSEPSQEILPEETASFGIDGYYYEAEESIVEGLADNCLFAPVLSGEKIYYARDDRTDNTQPNKYTIICYDTEQATYQEIAVADPDFYWFRVMAADGQGNLYLLLEKYGKKITPGSGVTHMEYELRKLGPDGQELYRRDATSSLLALENITLLNYMEIDGKGRCYIPLRNCFALFDENGAYWGTIEKDQNCSSLGRGGDGRIYLQRNTWEEKEKVWKNNLFALDFENKTIEKISDCFLDTLSYQILEIPGNPTELAVTDHLGLYRFDLQSQKLTQLLKWSDSGLDEVAIGGISYLEDGRILIIGSSAGGTKKAAFLLTKTAIEDTGEKQQLVIGALSSTPIMEKAVISFNRSSESYEVILRDYSGGGRQNSEDAWVLLSGELAAGNGPDLLVLNQLPELEACLEKEMFSDLTPYLERSTLLNREDYPEPLLSMYTYKGTLAGIPESFSLQTLMGKTEFLGDRIGWTLEEMMDFAKAHTDVRLTEQNTRLDILSCCLLFHYRTFLDKEKGECSFQSPEFMEILEFAASFPEASSTPSDSCTLEEQLQSGEILLTDVSFSEVEGYVRSNMVLFGNAPVTFIGYPSPEGTAGCRISACNEVYGILASSAHPEGAWEFVEAWLAGNLRRSDNSAGFPANRQKLEQALLRGLDEKHMETQGLRPMTEEELETLYGLIDRATPEQNYDQAVLAIILEEANDYFAGIRTAQEAAGHIQNRVQLYLQELQPPSAAEHSFSANFH